MPRRVVLIIVLLLLNFGGMPVRAQTTQAAPYLYYFSDKQKAFVIERADGTDTRLLGAGLMTLTTSDDIAPFAFQISGPGWSPSGKWFAWTAAQVSYSNQSGDKPYIISADGTHRVTVLDNLDNARIFWAPHYDRLLVVSQVHGDKEYTQTLHTFIALVNPTTNTLTVLKNEFSIDYYNTLYPNITWTSQGTGVIEYNASSPDSLTVTRKEFTVVDSTGQVRDKTFDHVLLSDDYGLTPIVSVTGNIAYTRADTLVVENVITGQAHSLSRPTSKSLSIRWSPDGRYGLLLGDGVWLIEPEANTLRLIQKKYVLPNWTDQKPRPIWAPDSKQALFISSEKLYHLSADTDQLTTLDINASDNTSDLMWRWTADSQALLGSISGDADKHYFVYKYDQKNGITQQIDLGDKVNAPFDVSTEGRYIAYMADGAVIYDTQNGNTRPIRPDANSYRSIDDGEVAWGSSSDWFLIFDDAIVASGGYFRYLDVTRADGFGRRDLSYAVEPTANTFNWLPPQVKPEMLAPVLKKPLQFVPKQVLHSTNWSTALSWSPDGKQIAGIDDSLLDAGPITTWNLTTGGALQLPAPKGTYSSPQFKWTRTTDGSYTPTLMSLTTTPWMVGRFIMAISPDGRQVFAYEDNSNPQGNPTGVHDVTTGKLIQPLGYEFLSYTSASYSPDGHLLVVGTPNESPQIYDTRTWQSVATLPHAAPGVAFSPDGRQLAITASWDVEIYDVSDLIPPDVICSEQRVACF